MSSRLPRRTRPKPPAKKWVSTDIQSRYFENWKAHVPQEVNRLIVEWTRLWRDDKFDPWSDEPPGRITVNDTVKRFLKDHNCATRRSRATEERWSPSATQSDVEPRRQRLQAKHSERFISRPGLSGSTPRAYYNHLRTFFSYCAEKHWTYEDPTGKVSPPSEPRGSIRSIYLPRGVRVHLDRRTCGRRAATAENCLSRAHELAMATGMRVGELYNRTWGDVDWERNSIHVDNQPLCDFTTKNDPSERIILLWPRARKILERRAQQRISEDPNEPVFLAPRHRTAKKPFVDLDWALQPLHRAPRRSGRGRRHPSTAADISFIKYVLALGVPVSRCMRMVGQVKHDTLAVYTRMLDELLQEAPGAALARYLPGI